MMRRDLRSVATVVATAGSNAFATALLGVITARALGPSGQGELTVVTTAVAVVGVGAVLGTGASLRLRGVPSPSDHDVQAFVGLSLVMAPLGGLLSCTVVRLVSSVGGMEMLLVFVLGSAGLTSFQASQLVQAYGLVARSLAAAGIGVSAQVTTFAALALAGHASLLTALASAISGSLVQTVFAVGGIRAHLGAVRPRRAAATWRELIGHGWPTVGYSLGLVGMQRMDRLILVAIAGPAVGGIYAVAATVAEVVRVGSTAVGQLLFVRSAGSQRVSTSVRRMYALAIGVQAVGIAALAISAPGLIQFVFGDAYVSAAPFVRGLVVGEFFLGLSLMDGRILLGHGRFVEVSAVTVGIFGASLPVYWLAIGAWGAWGAVGGSIGLYAAYSTCLLAMRVGGLRFGRTVPSTLTPKPDLPPTA